MSSIPGQVEPVDASPGPDGEGPPMGPPGRTGRNRAPDIAMASAMDCSSDKPSLRMISIRDLLTGADLREAAATGSAAGSLYAGAGTSSGISGSVASDSQPSSGAASTDIGRGLWA
eukprot:CAMPEP_0175545148 /NCGR_PEP_ID=MMETSP0096-20121207/29136_1 /TAXON_ID=311494 /ORGANISM="Alexandrium monilatum, Strain CCMP3105" /LENGTH=115 /DNA_ID=CAMNT_0016848109 /DNA_START=24 /DNA_END=367 /DNA_ORIENTATION=-